MSHPLDPKSIMDYAKLLYEEANPNRKDIEYESAEVRAQYVLAATIALKVVVFDSALVHPMWVTKP